MGASATTHPAGHTTPPITEPGNSMRSRSPLVRRLLVWLLAAVPAGGCGRTPAAPDPSPYAFVVHQACDAVVLPADGEPLVLRQVTRVENRADYGIEVRLVGRSCSCATVMTAPEVENLSASAKTIESGFAVNPHSSAYIVMDVKSGYAPGIQVSTASFDVLGSGGRVIGREVVRARYEALHPFHATPSVIRGFIDSGMTEAATVPLVTTLEAHVPVGWSVAEPRVTEGGNRLTRVQLVLSERTSLSPTITRYRWTASCEVSFRAGEKVVEGNLQASLPDLPGHSVRVPFSYSVQEAVALTPATCQLGAIDGDAGPVTKVFFVAARDGVPLTITGLDCPADVAGDWSTGVAASHRLSVTFRSPGRLKVGDSLTVRTSHPKGAAIVVPVNFSREP